MRTPRNNIERSERIFQSGVVVCPIWGGEVTPIAYGFPGDEIWKAAAGGKIVLGGCCVDPVMPSAMCPACEIEFVDTSSD